MKDIERRKRREIIPEPAGRDDRLRCHNCKQPYDPNAQPALWFPTAIVHTFTNTLPIMLHQFCCGAISHTEPVAGVCAYLQPVKENARLVCNLMNQYLLAGRPQPPWLTEAWLQWESIFARPAHRSKRRA